MIYYSTLGGNIDTISPDLGYSQEYTASTTETGSGSTEDSVSNKTYHSEEPSPPPDDISHPGLGSNETVNWTISTAYFSSRQDSSESCNIQLGVAPTINVLTFSKSYSNVLTYNETVHKHTSSNTIHSTKTISFVQTINISIVSSWDSANALYKLSSIHHETTSSWGTTTRYSTNSAGTPYTLTDNTDSDSGTNDGTKTREYELTHQTTANTNTETSFTFMVPFSSTYSQQIYTSSNIGTGTETIYVLTTSEKPTTEWSTHTTVTSSTTFTVPTTYFTVYSDITSIGGIVVYPFLTNTILLGNQSVMYYDIPSTIGTTPTRVTTIWDAENIYVFTNLTTSFGLLSDLASFSSKATNTQLISSIISTYAYSDKGTNTTALDYASTFESTDTDGSSTITVPHADITYTETYTTDLLLTARVIDLNNLKNNSFYTGTNSTQSANFNVVKTRTTSIADLYSQLFGISYSGTVTIGTFYTRVVSSSKEVSVTINVPQPTSYLLPVITDYFSDTDATGASYGLILYRSSLLPSTTTSRYFYSVTITDPDGLSTLNTAQGNSHIPLTVFEDSYDWMYLDPAVPLPYPPPRIIISVTEGTSNETSYTSTGNNGETIEGTMSSTDSATVRYFPSIILEDFTRLIPLAGGGFHAFRSDGFNTSVYTDMSFAFDTGTISIPLIFTNELTFIDNRMVLRQCPDRVAINVIETKNTAKRSSTNAYIYQCDNSSSAQFTYIDGTDSALFSVTLKSSKDSTDISGYTRSDVSSNGELMSVIASSLITQRWQNTAFGFATTIGTTPTTLYFENIGQSIIIKNVMNFVHGNVTYLAKEGAVALTLYPRETSDGTTGSTHTHTGTYELENLVSDTVILASVINLWATTTITDNDLLNILVENYYQSFLTTHNL